MACTISADLRAGKRMHRRFALLALGLLAGSAYARDTAVDGIVYEERDGRAGRSADEPGVADVA
ncbi:hypothetical protein P1999_20330, partial [Xanthomonas perforans]